MKKQQIISELKRLLNIPEITSTFESQQACLSWANEVATLLKPCKEHYAHFMESLSKLSVVGLSGDTYQSTFNQLLIIAKQGLHELEYNIPNNIETKNEIPYPDKITIQWLKLYVPHHFWFWFGTALLTAFLAGIFVGQTKLYHD